MGKNIKCCTFGDLRVLEGKMRRDRTECPAGGHMVKTKPFRAREEQLYLDSHAPWTLERTDAEGHSFGE